MATLGQYGEQLPAMTAQEVFDVVVDHLLTQNKQSLNSEGYSCVYDGGETCCAAAPFILNYIPEMEEIGWAGLIHKFGISNNHESLIEDMQKIHDGTPPQDWHNTLEKYSTLKGLQFNPPKTSEGD